jgi:hypothetical protein
VLYRLKNSAQTDGRTDGQTDRRTDDITISVEPIFLKMCSKKNCQRKFHNFEEGVISHVFGTKQVMFWAFFDEKNDFSYY